MQRSLFIANDYLEFKRRKLSFLHQSSLGNKQTGNYGRSWVQGRINLGVGASEEVENAA